MTNGSKRYVEIVNQLREMRGQSGVKAFERATLLVELYEDVGYRDHVRAADDLALAEVLDAEVDDLCLTFLELREMLKHYPTVSSWETGKLRSLYDSAQLQAADGKHKTRERVSWKSKFEELEAEHNDVKFELAELKKRPYVDPSDLDELKSENQRLLGRIDELEKMLDRVMDKQNT